MDPQKDVNPTSLEIFCRCGLMWKNHQSRSHQKTSWGVPFPSPKTFLSFWRKAHVGRYLNMDPQKDVNPTSLEIFSRCGLMWKKHQSRSHQKTSWGVPFPSPKTFLSFWRKTHVGRYLNMDPQKDVNPTSLEIFSRCGLMWKKHQSRSHQKTSWGVPFPSPKTVQNQRFYIVLLTKKNQVIVFEFLDESSCGKVT